MDKSFRDKVVVVTGASSGIGKSIVMEMAQRQATVILIARNVAKLEEIAAEAQALSGEDAYVIPADMSHAEEIDAAFAQITDKVDHVDYLINAAGFGDFEYFLQTDPKVITDMFQTNVLGLMYLTRLVARMMIDQESGHIVNMASMAGKVPTVKSAAYSASKAAVIGFSNVLRLELKPFNVKVMTVNPGPVYTNFFNVADKTGDYVKNVAWLMLDPEEVATKIVEHLDTNKRELSLPLLLAMAAKLYGVFPTIGDYLSIKFASEK